VTDPYRGSALDVPTEVPRDAGIVGDVIAQFADPKAFYRELVQNSIDAGSPSVEIKLEYEEQAQRMRVSVRDRGEGMTREIVENQLVVLFRSTKENDKGKIGKFGIGFVSVLSPNPEVVIVQTARDGKRITLHLYRDLSYDLFDSGAATQNGTTVELEIVLPPGDVDAFVRDSERSLVRWCRHASVPIELAVRVPGDTSTRRIDRPLAIENALVEARRTTDEGQLTVIVALVADATPYAGFFNHGLMLHESDRPLVGKLAVKIQDSRLGHTISRDDVRRDAHFRRAVSVAMDVAETELRREIGAKLAAHAEAHEHEPHGALLGAIIEAELGLAREWLHFPLAEAAQGKRSVRATQLPSDIWVASSSSALTAVLAEQGMPVLLASEPQRIASVLGQAVRMAERELTSIQPIEQRDGDQVLLALLHELLDQVHRPPDGILIATLAGAREDRLAIAGKSLEQPHVVDRDEAGRDPFALLRRRVLVLSAEHPQVRAARVGDPVLGASHLARALLLQHRRLDESRSRKIVEHTLERVGVDK
jgi:molecular chaperone HtpG